MAHVRTEKTKLLHRLRRIRGQLEAIERAVDRPARALVGLLDRGFMWSLPSAAERTGLAVGVRLRYTPRGYRSREPRRKYSMAHVSSEKTKLLNRLKRIRGQLEAIERAVESDGECARVLQQATACRGALDGFIAEVIEDHIREHMLDPAASRDDPRVRAAEELVSIVHAYLT